MLRRTTSVTTLCSRFYATTQQQPKVLITGCLGQIGSELVEIMRKKYGQQNVVATDVRVPHKEFLDQGPFEFCMKIFVVNFSSGRE